MTSKKARIRARVRRWRRGLNEAMPILLDTTGIILLSIAAMLFFGSAAGVALLGGGCFALNRNYYGGGRNQR
ncbi:hypothetical protein K4749_01310 [Streptomyces sp. TRM72054]|uniref:hypothetical protein n=1 Tax=Streptomyces sp. TRM72054 TaxID=2870562 RepID=UPI001C8B3F31|nr:hypothetical protein [Streptomyces sp. TRM72054]MBX9392269.1 hypothetical protein [Streptomyces sp. TRM72054]